ncbi:MAG: hypothetical protein AB8B83_09220 [Bdellovibrionales bacterium]
MKISDMPEFKDKSEVLTFEEDATVAEVVAGMAEKTTALHL